MDLELKEKGIQTTKHSEGSGCTCKGGVDGEEHRLFVARMDQSFIMDITRRRSAPTTETMRAKVLSYRNGHT